MDDLESTPVDSSLAAVWPRFVEELHSCSACLIRELEDCWGDLSLILETQLRQIEAMSPNELQSPLLENFQRAREQLSQKVLREPLFQWDRKQLYKRALMALERYDRSLADLARTLPSTLSSSGPQALKVLEKWHPPGHLQRLAGLRRKARPLGLESLVDDGLRKLSVERLKPEGEYFLVLLLAYRQLKKNWELTRAALDDSMSRTSWPQSRGFKPHQEANSGTRQLLLRAEDALKALQRWPEVSTQQLSRQILSAVVRQASGQQSGAAGRRAAALSYRAELLRALETEVKLEQTLEKTERRILNVSQRCLESPALELANLRAELENFIRWLRKRIEGSVEEDLPEPRVSVVPASSRLSEFAIEVKAALKALPETCNVLEEFSPLPERRSKPRQLRPRRTFDEALLRTGWTQITRVFQDIESKHRGIVQEIERAREVVSFGIGANNIEHDLDPVVTQEALKNALSLLEFQLAEAPAWRSSASQSVALALDDAFGETRLILNRDRLGAFAYLAQQGLRRTLRLACRNAAASAVQFLPHAYAALQRGLLSFLVYIGWRQKSSAGKPEVTTRLFLPQEFVIDLKAKELPAIYRRLFRFEAVQDPRFLVGREQEMAAIAEARTFWEAGRPVALIIVGERGSGKTSLINCALKRVLEDFEVLRGEFQERLVTEAQLMGFLAQLVSTDPDRLLEFFSERRRVVILEELERTFLRQVGCYAALRAMQRVIAATCSSTLWILVVNQVAFKFLDATVRLGDSFSHRIDAASASPDALRQAILLRHNLSGLRLKFAPLPSRDKVLQNLRILVRGQTDPESVFFDTLAKESGGAFRTAFDIWLGHIERVESGVLYMQSLAAPDLSPLITALDITDLFTLAAILQHGSLTPDEHARIFQKTPRSSRAQMDGLLAREIIEKDPGRTGFRVRPEALRVVHEAFYRRNLL